MLKADDLDLMRAEECIQLSTQEPNSCWQEEARKDAEIF